MIIKILWIHLAPDEWGSELMERVATNEFRARGCPSDLLIEVYEHAGWSLSYIWDEASERVIVVESANDSAVFQGKAAEWRSTRKEAMLDETLEYKYLGCIRREDKRESQPA
jgi:hypothetical protein